MKNKKITFCFILGTRPEIIKMFPLIMEVKRRNFSLEIIHTGQHHSKVLQDEIWQDLKLPPITKKIKLKTKASSSMLGEMVTGISQYLIQQINPNRVIIVQGDTNSTLAGALVANKLKIKLIHVEAGFRSGLRTQPEEINRILVDQMSDLNFASDKEALKNLYDDHLKKNSYLTFNTAYAAANYMTKHLIKRTNQFPPFRLMTIHRAENADNLQRLKNIWELANALACELPLVWVMHPRTMPQLEKMLKTKLKVQNHLKKKDLECAKLIFLSAQRYQKFFTLISQSQSILSDSGGIVDEAVFLSKPYICLRSETEQHQIIKKKRMLLISPELSPKELLSKAKKFEALAYPHLSLKDKNELIIAPAAIIEKIRDL